jgi:hypothetical protein
MTGFKPVPITSLTPRDLEQYPVWEYASSHELWSDETIVRPVKRLPVESLDGRVVGTRLTLANGAEAWGILGNIDPTNAELTEHFLTASVFSGDRWFTMARYHDVAKRQRGSAALAKFLGLSLREVFPIRYDIRKYVVGDAAALAGEIAATPRKALSRSELIGLAVPRKGPAHE